MSKTKDDRLVNRNVKKLNRQLANDVFGDRFYARQIQKGKGDGIMYYMYELSRSRNALLAYQMQAQ